MNQKKIVSTWKWFSHMDRVFGRSPIYLALHIGNLLWFPQLSFQILSQLEATRQVTSTTCQEAKAELYFGVSQVGSWPSGREDKRQAETEDFLGKYKKVCGKGTAALLGSLRTRRNNKWLRCSVSTSLVPFAPTSGSMIPPVVIQMLHKMLQLAVTHCRWPASRASTPFCLHCD